MATDSSRTMQGSNSPVLQELERLSRSLYKAHSSRRTTSLVLPRNIIDSHSDKLSYSSRNFAHYDLDDTQNNGIKRRTGGEAGEKRSIWSWKPMRALAHMAMHRLVCLFSVEVVAVQRLPASMNGLRLAVVVKKKDTKDGGVQTMPSRVINGVADFDEPLHVKCHLYCSGGAGTGKPLKFEPRLFFVYATAVDAPQLDFGRSCVDLSLLVMESIQKNLEGHRVRQWDMSFELVGKAKGGEMVVKLAFQILDDGGIGIYKQTDMERSAKAKGTKFSSPVKQSRSSFTVVSSTIVRSSEHSPVHRKKGSRRFSAGFSDFRSEKVVSSDSKALVHVEKSKKVNVEDDLDFPEFEVIDKGVEIEEVRSEAEISEDNTEGITSVSSEVVKEVVQDRMHRGRLKELDMIAKEIKALELIMARDDLEMKRLVTAEQSPRLDDDEETVTREFLQMLEMESDKEMASPKFGGKLDEIDWKQKTLLPDLENSLGPVVQTKDGGFLISMNPFNEPVDKKEAPKLTMQISKAFILKDQKLASGFEVFQRFAANGAEELCSKLVFLAAMDDLNGKTAGQIAFEGIALAVINGRTKEGASSCAARSIMLNKSMSTAMSAGRKERLLTGIWIAKKEPISVDEILMFSLQRVESMAIEVLKIQAGFAEEETAFDVFPVIDNENSKNLLDSAIPPEEWKITCSTDSRVTMLVVIQLRDPARSYESVGAPIVAVMQAIRCNADHMENESMFKLISLHVGGFKLRPGGMRTIWDGEKQRLTAMHWLVANEVVRGRKTSQQGQGKGSLDYIWSISSRVMADMWLKPVRNPNVKFLPLSG